MGDHLKISVLYMIMMHARDVTLRLIEEGTPGSAAYTWVSQLRHSWEPTDMKVTVSVLGSSLNYGFDYFGRTEAAMITPLTERCFVNIIQVGVLIPGVFH